MTTGNTASRVPHSRQPARHKAKFVLGTLALLVVVAFWGWRPLVSQAEAGTAFGARTACSCRFVAGRDLGDCEKDFADGMALVSLSEDEASKSVTARVPLISSTTATLREGRGCVLEPYEG